MDKPLSGKGRKTKVALIIHGGAEGRDAFVRTHGHAYRLALKAVVEHGYTLLQKGVRAVDVAETVIRLLEDDELFNCGRGSALTREGRAEMEAALMCGRTRRSGAVAVVRNVRHPISLARAVQDDGSCRFLVGEGALRFAQWQGMQFEADEYFIIKRRLRQLEKAKKKGSPAGHGTVGAVVLDRYGDLAAGTSTGGTANCLPGRVGDSSMVGVGCYADNRSCAVSGTGDGEYLMRAVLAHSVVAAYRYSGLTPQEACDRVVHTENAGIEGDMGVIALDRYGNMGISFNSEIMFRAWQATDVPLTVKIGAD